MYCLKRVPVKAFWSILQRLFSNPHNFGLEWTFWTVSVLKIIVLSLSIWLAQTYFDVGLMCACGGGLNRVAIKAFWPILPYLCLGTQGTHKGRFCYLSRRGGVTFCRFYFGMLPTQCPLPCPWTPPPPGINLCWLISSLFFWNFNDFFFCVLWFHFSKNLQNHTYHRHTSYLHALI